MIKRDIHDCDETPELIACRDCDHRVPVEDTINGFCLKCWGWSPDFDEEEDN